MPVVVYKIDGSPPCRAVNMVVDIIGLETESKLVNTVAKDQFKPEFLEKNPLHTVPIIEEGDFILNDSHAIITYLVSKYGADKRAELYPSDLKVRATIEQMLYFDATVLFPRFRAPMAAIMKDKAKELTKEQKDAIEETYGFLEKYLENSKFLAANHLTIADIANVATVSTLDIFVPIDPKFEKLREWFELLKKQEWYKTGNEPGLAMIDAFVKKMLTSGDSGIGK